MTKLNYINTAYSTSIEIPKSPAVAFNHIANNIPAFWPEDFEGESNQLNAEFTFRSGKDHYSKHRVSEFIDNTKIVWLVTDSIRKSDGFEWTGTKMIFEFIPKGNGTIITFTYDGLVIKDELERLRQICNFCINEQLYRSLASFTTTIELPASPQDVFRSITNIPVWWTTDFEGRSGQLNDEFTIHHPGAHYSEQKVIEAIPAKKIVWLVTESTLHWLQGNQREWKNTKMVFELTPSDGKTILHFTHEGLTPDKECYERVQQGWTEVILNRLSKYITTI